MSDIADIAQLVEQRTRNAKVAGSIPAGGANEAKKPESLSIRAFVLNGKVRRRCLIFSMLRAC